MKKEPFDPQGVIPAFLISFDAAMEIDETACEFRIFNPDLHDVAFLCLGKVPALDLCRSEPTDLPQLCITRAQENILLTFVPNVLRGSG